METGDYLLSRPAPPKVKTKFKILQNNQVLESSGFVLLALLPLEPRISDKPARKKGT